MKLNLSIAIICLAASLLTPAAHAQTTPPVRGRSVQMVVPVLTPYLGINALDITADRAKVLKLKDVRGVEVTNVDPESGAAKAGLKEGDVILEYNGQNVEGWEQLRRMVSETPVNREVKIGIWRNGAAQTLTAVVGSHPHANNEAIVIPNGGNNFPFKMDAPMMSMVPSIEMPEFRTFSQNRTIGIFGEPLGQEEQLAEFFGVKNGVLIRSVVKGSAAEKTGIKAGDVITKIDDTVVTSPAEISGALRAAGSKRTFNVTLVRNKKEIVLSLTLDTATSVHGGLWRYWAGDQDGWFDLQFPPYDGVIEGAKKSAAKIIWQ